MTVLATLANIHTHGQSCLCSLPLLASPLLAQTSFPHGARVLVGLPLCAGAGCVACLLGAAK